MSGATYTGVAAHVNAAVSMVITEPVDADPQAASTYDTSCLEKLTDNDEFLRTRRPVSWGTLYGTPFANLSINAAWGTAGVGYSMIAYGTDAAHTIFITAGVGAGANAAITNTFVDGTYGTYGPVVLCQVRDVTAGVDLSFINPENASNTAYTCSVQAAIVAGHQYIITSLVVGIRH